MSLSGKRSSGGLGRGQVQSLLPAKTPESFGAVGNGIADDTGAFVRALSIGNVRLEGKTGSVYLIKNTVPVGSNTVMSRVKLTHGLPDSRPLFEATGQNSIVFDSIEATGPVVGANAPYLLQAVRSSKISLANSNLLNVLGIHTLSGLAYGVTTPTTMSSRIWVLNNSITLQSALGRAAVLLDYTDGAQIRNNTIVGGAHGIQWWGGDANPTADGIVSNTRKCTNIRISENSVTDVSGGGIWGSMGRNVLVSGNTVERCGDVGIDFEGTFDSVASQNTVNDCVNGEMALFFESNNVKFLDNQIRTLSTPLKFAATNCSGIVFNGNVAVCAGTTTINDSGGVIDGIEISGNKFTNVCINLSNPRGRQRNIVIADNEFSLNNIFAIYVVTNSTSSVKILRNSATANGGYANFAYDLQFQSTVTDSNILIEGNTSTLYAKGIRVLAGASSGRIISQINANTVGTLEFIVGASANNKQVLRGNYVDAGPVADSTTP